MLLFNLHSLGIPDEQGKRALCWKLLLNYLPPSRKTWSETLTRKRELYKQFIGNRPLSWDHTFGGGGGGIICTDGTGGDSVHTDDLEPEGDANNSGLLLVLIPSPGLSVELRNGGEFVVGGTDVVGAS
uniref:(California timema) hypothetical protein n=1 Tax=Timema californicum TaxID=61474 RepID=A0A7R9J8J9_TIMCA|nr:unnamed protein product [Timema californicum]